MAVEKDKLEIFPQSICKLATYFLSHSRNIVTCAVTGPHMNCGVGLGMQVFQLIQVYWITTINRLEEFLCKTHDHFYITS